MFRRKDELDMDAEFTDGQGSLLGEPSEGVSVLSPQKAAEYKAEQASSPAATQEVKSSVPQASHSASFSSPSSLGQAQPSAQTTRPIQAAEPVRPAASAAPSASNSNLSSPASVASAAIGATVAPRVSEPARFRASQEPSRSASTPSTPTSNYNSESNMLKQPNSNERILTVGNDILLKGEITTCDRLVIEGKVDATVSEVHTMELAAAGTFNGTAEVEYAEISGSFEGNLTVRTSLVIKSSGRVSGNITYGDIEIARGGVITGEIKTIATQPASGKKNEKIAA